MNKLECGACRHYDQKFRMANGKLIPLAYGWCARKSVYPQEGQAPEGAQRAASGEMAKPVIVKTLEVVSSCIYAVKK